MADWLGLTSYAAGIVTVAGLGYAIGIGRGRRRERRAHHLQDRLHTAVAGFLDRRQAPRPARTAARATARMDPPVLLK